MSSGRRILVTCGRFHPATGIVRALHAGGARVDLADPYPLAPALHSRAADQLHVVASAAAGPIDYARDIAEIVRQRRIDLVVPAYEDGFYLARYAEKIGAPLFAPTFGTVARLHNKSRFVQLCADLGLPTPKSEVAARRDDLQAAVAQFDSFVARPSFSRGGQVCLTNRGPRAGETTIEACDPNDDNPWLVQEFLEGEDACSFSIARDGEVVVHCVYEPTIASAGGFSVQFASIDDFGSLQATAKVCAELNYTGFIGFDYRRTADGFVMIECNPRSTAGIFLVPRDWVSDAVLSDPRDLRVVEPGGRRQYDGYLLNRHVVRVPPRQLIHELLTTPDVYLAADDVLPAIYFFFCLRHWTKIAKREHISFSRAFLGDVSWNGAPMPDWSQGLNLGS